VTLFFTLLTVAVLGVVAAVAAGRITADMDDPVSSLPARGLPEGGIESAALADVRFSPALRGYRMEEVDEVMDRLRQELERREEELAGLRALLDGSRAPEAADPAGDGPLLPEQPLLSDRSEPA